MYEGGRHHRRNILSPEYPRLWLLKEENTYNSLIAVLTYETYMKSMPLSLISSGVNIRKTIYFLSCKCVFYISVKNCTTCTSGVIIPFFPELELESELQITLIPNPDLDPALEL